MGENQLGIELCAILTGGRAKRMGGRKADVRLAGKALVERVYERVAPLCRETVCVGGHDYLTHLGVKTIPDLFMGANSLGGIATALGYAADTHGPDALVLAVACDMPLIARGIIERLREKMTPGVEVSVVKGEFGYEPLCALYRASAFDTFAGRARRNELRIAAAFEALRVVLTHPPELAGADPELRSFLNVNRPDDLEKVKQLIDIEERGERGLT